MLYWGDEMLENLNNIDYDEQIIWRYMKVKRLENMLLSKKLYLRRVDLFRGVDQYEGQRSPDNVAVLNIEDKDTLEQIKKFNLPAADYDRIKRFLEDNSKNREAKKSYISCWHMKDEESDVMWKVFGNDESEKYIAIKTTVGKLKQAILDKQFVYYQPVKYSDMLDNNFDGIWYKNSAYSYEREFRVAKVLNGRRLKSKTGDFLELFLNPVEAAYLPIDTSKLIDAIYIGPYHTEECYQQVKNMLEKIETHGAIKIVRTKFTESYMQNLHDKSPILQTYDNRDEVAM